MSFYSTTSIPKVSIVTAVRNGEKYLGESILSLINQTYIDFELIAIDDHSQDSTAQIIEEFARMDPRIKYVKNIGSPGLSNALNLGLTHAQGELIARHDADDISLSDRLTKQVDYLDKHLDIDIVGSFIEMMNEAGETLRIHHEPVGVAAVKFHSLFGTPFAHPTVMIRAHFLKQNDLRYSEIPSQDYDLWVRMLNCGAKGDNIPEALVRYRISQQSDSNVRAHRHALMTQIIAKNQLILYTQKTRGLNKYSTENFQKIAHCLITANQLEVSYSDVRYMDKVRKLLSTVESRLECNPREISALYKRIYENQQFLFSKKTVPSVKEISKNFRSLYRKFKSKNSNSFISLTNQELNDFVINVPVFINVRDRLSCLQTLISWLEDAGHKNIILIDNASTYPPLQTFLSSCKHRVIKLDKNLGHTALWKIPEVKGLIAGNWYVYTDPDVIPDENCPKDVVGHFYNILLNYPTYTKAGFGLRVDDLPTHYHLKDKVIEWEENFYKNNIGPDLYDADIDTTFALYRPGTSYCYGPAIRTKGVYQARHMPWYINSDALTAEEIYYREHALGAVTTWNVSGDVKVLIGNLKYLNIKWLINRINSRVLLVFKKLINFH